MVCNGDDAEKVSCQRHWGERRAQSVCCYRREEGLCVKFIGTDVANEAAEAVDDTAKGKSIMRDTWT